MPPTKTPTRKPTPAAHKRQEHNADVLDNVLDSLNATQKAMSSLQGDLGTGARDLRDDVKRMIRDARRDVAKMTRAVRKDINRLQRELGGTTTRKPTRRPSASKSTRAKPAARRRG